MNYPYDRHIIYKILCKWTCQTCFSGEWLKAPWASCCWCRPWSFILQRSFTQIQKYSLS